ncbi:MAG: outer membrane beta-barrel protein [Rubripirellula sp.]
MRCLKFHLPVLVAATFVASCVVGAEPRMPEQVDERVCDNYSQTDFRSNEAHQYCDTAPQQAAVAPGAARFLDSACLCKQGIQTSGFVDIGIGANNWGADWNGPVSFNDRSWQGQMNQLYFITERVLQENELSWGGRVDLLYGTDSIYTTASGLDGPPSDWSTNRYYGLAMPQIYGELGSQKLNVKVGHFYTLLGYEVVPATGNFFYTHSYTMTYGEPFTHTGVLGTWNPNDRLSIIGGVTNGWDNWDVGASNNQANPSSGSSGNAAFLGAVKFTSCDGTRALTIANSTGKQESGAENAAGQSFTGTCSITSLVYSNDVTGKLTYVFQGDFGYQENSNPFYETPGQPSGAAYWYGLNQYLFYNFTDYLAGGLRFEWFRDNNGTRVLTGGLRSGAATGNGNGFAGNFCEMTWGLNCQLGKNIVIRPELRYDWFKGDDDWFAQGGGGPGNMPYGKNLERDSQFYGGCDIIWSF